jgi:hypothetical protein
MNFIFTLKIYISVESFTVPNGTRCAYTNITNFYNKIVTFTSWRIKNFCRFLFFNFLKFYYYFLRYKMFDSQIFLYRIKIMFWKFITLYKNFSSEIFLKISHISHNFLQVLSNLSISNFLLISKFFLHFPFFPIIPPKSLKFPQIFSFSQFSPNSPNNTFSQHTTKPCSKTLNFPKQFPLHSLSALRYKNNKRGSKS